MLFGGLRGVYPEILRFPARHKKKIFFIKAGGTQNDKGAIILIMKHHKAITWVSGSHTPEKTYITRVFNFGTWREWNALKRTFLPQQIEDVVRHPLRGQWTKRGKAFAEVIFECRMPNNVLISYDV